LLLVVGCGGTAETVETTSDDIRATFYHGGPVIPGTVGVYYIWYGGWAGNDARLILRPLIANLSGSAYWNFITTYPDSSGAAPANALIFGGGVNVGYSHGRTLQDADLQSIVTNQVAYGHLPLDPNAVYVVLSSADVVEFGPNGRQFCSGSGGFGGYHAFFSAFGVDLKYAFVGDPSQQACSSQLQNVPSPNGNPGADVMAAIIAHEIAEAITDPLIGTSPAYTVRGSDGGEVGDLCERSHGVRKGYVTLNGTTYFLQPFPKNVGGHPGPCGFD
jgi:hypothetical protein